MKILLLAESLRDLADGVHFYERQAAGVGAYFLDSILADVESLQYLAGTHQIVFGCHRKLAKRFPFAIYYKIENNTVRIRAILDCRADPARIRERLM